MITVLSNCDIYTGSEVLSEHSIVLRDGIIESVTDTPPVGADEVVDLDRRSVAPGFIDIQVNGGGDVLLNDEPTEAGVHKIAAAHRKFGTTDILPTFITGPLDGMRKAAAAVDAARKTDPGVLGIHFEGPVISPKKLGVHAPDFVREADDAVFAAFTSASSEGKTIVTLAPELAPPGFIRRLKSHGVLVAAGHTNATGDDMKRGFAEGITLGTHVWNAMSPLTSREPGAVGALLADDGAWCDFVADGYHLDFTTLAVSLRSAAPRGFLVTDAMSPVGGTKGSYRLGDLEVTVVDGRCQTADGTLAGSALDLATAVRNLVQKIGVPKDEALRMASTYPAEFLGLGHERGRIAPGYPAHLAIFDNEIYVSAIYYNGQLIQTS
ncbi:N-acetylglucosamine-6-phosphate deacetylase [Nocardioides marinus]|uniref:N-acetylglucosamine-6-phosphate deacetylase n=1 Tax=Nocardioides marinus TaxID=374514 RepID=A0A7Y9YEP2_9ACTN|nr:N-acetylglucosamine-6-phosphate deacetylase [Nocardioides marinus]NYI09867.1 N-acetylglucosamine-6-phosphate deacetylase [Nocardioides marinus]